MYPALPGGGYCGLCWLFDYTILCSDIAWEVFELETQRQKGIPGDGFIVVTDVMERENKQVSVKSMRGINSFSMPGISKMVKSIYRVKVIVDSDLIISLS